MEINNLLINNSLDKEEIKGKLENILNIIEIKTQNPKNSGIDVKKSLDMFRGNFIEGMSD